MNASLNKLRNDDVMGGAKYTAHTVRLRNPLLLLLLSFHLISIYLHLKSTTSCTLFPPTPPCAPYCLLLPLAPPLSPPCSPPKKGRTVPILLLALNFNCGSYVVVLKRDVQLKNSCTMLILLSQYTCYYMTILLPSKG